VLISLHDVNNAVGNKQMEPKEPKEPSKELPSGVINRRESSSQGTVNERGREGR
jgi:hypothetical protein